MKLEENLMIWFLLILQLLALGLVFQYVAAKKSE